MKKKLTVLFLSLFSISAMSQQASEGSFQNKNSFQFELGGHGLIYSFNVTVYLGMLPSNEIVSFEGIT